MTPEQQAAVDDEISRKGGDPVRLADDVTLDAPERAPYDPSAEGVIRAELRSTSELLEHKRAKRETLRLEIAALLERQTLLKRAANVFDKADR